MSTKFEQYENIFTSLGLSASYDDLRTDGSASDALKDKVVNLLNYQLLMVLIMIREIDHSCQQVEA